MYGVHVRYFKHVENDVHVRRTCAMNVYTIINARRTCTPYMYDSVYTACVNMYGVHVRRACATYTCT